MSVYSFITKPFRYAEKAFPDVRNLMPLARTVEINSRLTTLADAQVVADAIAGILASGPRRRFDIPVIGVDVVVPDDMDGTPPCAMLFSDRFSLQAGLLVLIPDFTINLNQGQTVLRCWG